MVATWKTFSLTIVSAALSAVVISNAYYQKKQFYPTVVHITNSSPSMAVLYIQGFVVAWIISQIAKKVFFGKLLDPEVEHVVDEFWYAVPETCLLFAAFREDLTPLFVVSLTTLFLVKAFHWLADARIDLMERSPLITKLFHVRAVFLLMVLIATDCFMIISIVRGLLSKGPSVQMVYALEYAVLLLLVVDVLGKYVFHCIDRQSEHPWENKTIYKAYLEVLLGSLKVLAFFGFMVFMARVHIFPLYITRRLFMAIKSCKKSIEDVVKSRRAIHNLNNLFPDVTAEQMEGKDNTCMVCRDEMALSCKLLPCGHIFHTACLRSWFQRQQVCPTCSSSVLLSTKEEQLRLRQQKNRMRQQQQQQREANQPEQRQENEAQPQPGGGPLPPLFPQGFPGWVAPPPPPQVGFVQDQPPPDPTPGQLTGHEAAAVSQDKDKGAKSEEEPNLGGAFPPMGAPGSVPLAEWLKGAGGLGQTLQSPTGGAPLSANLLPPIPPYFTPFGAPAPDPSSLKLNLLSDEQLEALEGSERENAEARIGVLRNIQLLLDSAVVQMNQYYVTTGNLPFQDSLRLTDPARLGGNKSGKKKKHMSHIPKQPTSTPQPPPSFEGGIGRSVTWSPSVASTPSVFSSLLGDKEQQEEKDEEVEELSFAGSESVELKRSISTPPSTDVELRQRRLERLESFNRSTSSILEPPMEKPAASSQKGSDEDNGDPKKS